MSTFSRWSWVLEMRSDLLKVSQLINGRCAVSAHVLSETECTVIEWKHLNSGVPQAEFPGKQDLRWRWTSRRFRRHCIVEKKKKEAGLHRGRKPTTQLQHSLHNVSASPSGSSEDVMTIQGCSEFKWKVRAFISPYQLPTVGYKISW